MKLILKILGILILLIVIAMVTIPYFYRDQIVEKLKQEINNNVNARVDFVDFDLSLFRSFPNFNFMLEGLSIVNKAPFIGDTLAWIPEFEITLDMMSVIKGDAYELKKITVVQPVINALVLKNGTANWDIAIDTGNETESAEEAATEESPFVIKLSSVTITNARIVYDDKSLATYTLLQGVDHSLSGDFTMDFTSLKTKTTIKHLTVIYDGVKYFNKVDVELNAVIDADLVNSIYTLKNNELRLNQLYLGFDGSVAMQDNGDINLMLTYSSKKSNFKNFLSLIPAIYAKDFDGIQSSGTMAITGNVKGIYNDDSYPAFALNILVQDGYFQYPDLPKSVENVNINTKIAFPGGDLDNLTVNISDFEMTMAGNEISASLFIKNPMTDIGMKGAINGKIDLSKVKDIYPLEGGDKLLGRITSNVSFEGKMSSLEKEKYDEFNFLGSVLLEDFKYSTPYLPEQVSIRKAQLNFSPEYLDLVSFTMTLGRNTFSAKGKIENFMPYMFADGILYGNLVTNSGYLNISDLMPEDSENAEPSINPKPESTDTPAMEIIEIPANIDFTLTANYKKVIYDDIELNNLKGGLVIKNHTVNLEKLKMEVLDGTVTLSGKYDTKDTKKPVADMTISISNISIQQAYATFGTLEKFAPIAEKTEGKFFTNFNLKTNLDKELMPVYSSMNGGGNLKTSQITIENVNSINKLADALKMPDLKRLILSPVNLTFEFINGKLHVKPFDIKYQDITTNVSGWTSFDQTISYNMIMTVPREKFGGQANAILDNLVNEANKLGTNFSVGETVNIKASITGTIINPKVKIMPGEGSGKNMLEDLRKIAEEELRKQKEKLEEEARKEYEKKKAEAKKEADKILADAEREADNILNNAQIQMDAMNKTARESADKAKQEAQKQVDNILNEAKKNGPIAQIAAKATTDEILKKANKKAEDIVGQAEKESAKIMKTASNKAGKIRSDAQKKADKVYEDL